MLLARRSASRPFCPSCYHRRIDSLTTLIAGVSLGIWVYLLFFRGMFWRVGPLLQRPNAQPGSAGGRLIPARDEEEVLGEALDQLRAQQFQGEIYIFVVDDNSSDATSELARRRGATVLEAGPLPASWTGKLWAVSRGVQAALAVRSDYILLTDADIAHGPTSVRDLVARDFRLLR